MKYILIMTLGLLILAVYDFSCRYIGLKITKTIIREDYNIPTYALRRLIVMYDISLSERTRGNAINYILDKCRKNIYFSNDTIDFFKPYKGTGDITLLIKEYKNKRYIVGYEYRGI